MMFAVHLVSCYLQASDGQPDFTNVDKTLRKPGIIYLKTCGM